MKKKVVSLLMAGVMALSLAACGGAVSGDNAGASDSGSAKTESKSDSSSTGSKSGDVITVNIWDMFSFMN